MGVNQRAVWQERVAEAAVLPAAPSVSPGRPDASNPPGWCWRCRSAAVLSGGCLALSRTAVPARRVTAERSRWPRWHKWPRCVSPSLPPPEQQPHCPASLTVSGDQPSLRSESKRAVEAPRPLSPVPPAGSAGGALQLHGDAVGSAGKVCQGGCSQWACMDAWVQTGSYRAASRCQFEGLMKYCPDGNVMTQKGFYTVILHPGLSAAGQRLTWQGWVLGRPMRCTDPQRVIGQMKQMTEPS